MYQLPPPSSTGSKDMRPAAASAKPAPAAAKPLPTTCNRKHNNANAKELKMMGYNQKQGPAHYQQHMGYGDLPWPANMM